MVPNSDINSLIALIAMFPVLLRDLLTGYIKGANKVDRKPMNCRSGSAYFAMAKNSKTPGI